jgi:hypothetical protein
VSAGVYTPVQLTATVYYYQEWHPKNESNHGHKLLGWDFMCPLPGQIQVSCCCESNLCFGVGYYAYMARVPKDKVENIILGLGCKGGHAHEVQKYPRVHHVAPWHFAPEHRYFDENNGVCKLVRYGSFDKFLDNDGKVWLDYPPQTTRWHFLLLKKCQKHITIIYQKKVPLLLSIGPKGTYFGKLLEILLKRAKIDGYKT